MRMTKFLGCIYMLHMLYAYIYIYLYIIFIYINKYMSNLSFAWNILHIFEVSQINFLRFLVWDLLPLALACESMMVLAIKQVCGLISHWGWTNLANCAAEKWECVHSTMWRAFQFHLGQLCITAWDSQSKPLDCDSSGLLWESHACLTTPGTNTLEPLTRNCMCSHDEWCCHEAWLAVVGRGYIPLKSKNCTVS